MAKLREEFLEAIALPEGENEAFVAFVDRHNSREEFDLAEFLQTFPRKDYQQMWSAIVTKVEQVVLSREYLPGSHRKTNEDNDESENTNSAALTFLRAVAQFAQIFLEVGTFSLCLVFPFSSYIRCRIRSAKHRKNCEKFQKFCIIFCFVSMFVEKKAAPFKLLLLVCVSNGGQWKGQGQNYW